MMICADEYPILKQGDLDSHFKSDVEYFYNKIQQDKFSIFTRPEQFLSLLVEQLILFFANEASADPAIIFTAEEGSLLHKLGAPVGNVLNSEYIGLNEHAALNQHFNICLADEKNHNPTLIVSETTLNYPNNTNLRDKNFAVILPFYQQQNYLGTLKIYLETNNLSQCLFANGHYRTTLNAEDYPAFYFFQQKVYEILQQFIAEISTDNFVWQYSYADFEHLPSVMTSKLKFLEVLEEQETKSIDTLLTTFQEHFFILDRVFIQLQKKLQRYLLNQGYQLDQTDPFHFVYSYGTPQDTFQGERNVSYFLTSDQIQHLFSHHRSAKDRFDYKDFTDFWQYMFTLDNGAGLSGQVLKSGHSYYIKNQQFAPQWSQWIQHNQGEKEVEVAKKQWALFLKALRVKSDTISATYFVPIISSKNRHNNLEILAMVQCVMKNGITLSLEDRKQMFDIISRESSGIEMAITSTEQMQAILREKAQAEERSVLFYTTSHHLKTPINLAKMKLNSVIENSDAKLKTVLQEADACLQTSLGTINLLMNASFSEKLGFFDENQKKIDIYQVIKTQITNIEDFVKLGKDEKVPPEKITQFMASYSALFLYSEVVIKHPIEYNISKSEQSAIEAVCSEFLKNAIRYSYQSPAEIAFYPLKNGLVLEIKNQVHPATQKARAKDLFAGKPPRHSVGLRGTYLICKGMQWPLSIQLINNECVVRVEFKFGESL